MTAAIPRAPIGVSLANWRTEPFSQWSFSHVSELIPSAVIAHDPWQIVGMTEVATEMDTLAYRTKTGEPGTIASMLANSSTDGFLVIHRGCIVAERYMGHLDRHRPHIFFSVSKSITGSLAGVLVESGQLDVQATLSHYLPELAGSAYANASVRDLLDMTVAIDFEEAYLDPDSDFMRYRRAIGWNPVPPLSDPSDLRSFLSSTRRGDGPHGHRYHYVSPNSDLLGLVMERVAGTRFADLLSEQIWRRIGAEMPAQITLDRLGAPRAAGGISATLRDLGRFGEMMRQGGRSHGQQVVPQAWMDDIIENGDTSAWQRGGMSVFIENGRYRSNWYILDKQRGSFCAIGIHGQWLYIDRRSEVVIVKLSCQPKPEDDETDRHVLAAFDAISTQL